LAERALVRIAQLMRELPDDLLAATARSIAGRSVPAELVALFAARGASASAALVAAADLTPGGWSAVKAVAAPDVVPLLAALGQSSNIPAQAVEQAPQQLPSTSQVLPRAPEPKPQPQPQPALPAGLFRWETGP